jgi:SAM-dependent methyltransferase
VGLAEAVAPGEAVGLDVDAGQLDVAASLASERGLSNARFEAGSVYELPYPVGYFDAAFCYAVFMDLKEPVKALREPGRVLKPGGVIGVRESDERGNLLPHMPPAQKLIRHSGRRPADRQPAQGSPAVGGVRARGSAGRVRHLFGAGGRPRLGGEHRLGSGMDRLKPAAQPDGCPACLGETGALWRWRESKPARATSAVFLSVPTVAHCFTYLLVGAGDCQARVFIRVHLRSCRFAPFLE